MPANSHRIQIREDTILTLVGYFFVSVFVFWVFGFFFFFLRCSATGLNKKPFKKSLHTAQE